METGSWIAIYLPILVILIAQTQYNTLLKIMIIKRQKKRGNTVMTNELLQNFIGKRCKISAGPYGTTVRGVIQAVVDNWIDVETRQGRELVNAEFVQNITMLRDA